MINAYCIGSQSSVSDLVSHFIVLKMDFISREREEKGKRDNLFSKTKAYSMTSAIVIHPSDFMILGKISQFFQRVFRFNQTSLQFRYCLISICFT